MFFWMRTMIAPIRVDPMLLVPLLYLSTVVLLLACLRGHLRFRGK